MSAARCRSCGAAIDWARTADREHVALMNVSGALFDSGEVVPEDECQWGEAVRKITARAEAAEAKLAEAQKAWRESRGPLTAALDRLEELEAKLRDVVDAWDAPAPERTHPTLRRLHDPIQRARAALAAGRKP